MVDPHRLSAPTIYTRADLESDQGLVTQITRLINDAFTRSKKSDLVKWGANPRVRFTDSHMYFDMLGSEGVVAAIFDEDTADRRLVAVAGAIPWQGGWKNEGAGIEEGWEIKAVAVDGDAKYLRRGLAVQLYNALQEHLLLESKQSGISTTKRKFNQQDQLTLWILAAECINGVYWRKKGFELVRKDVVEAPTWGVLTEFEMIVLRKDIPFELPKGNIVVDSKDSVVATGGNGIEVR